MCFSESTSRVVLSVAPDRLNEVLGRAGSGRVPAMVLGDAGGDRLHAVGAFSVALAGGHGRVAGRDPFDHRAAPVVG